MSIIRESCAFIWGKNCTSSFSVANGCVKLYSQLLTRLRIFVGCNFFLYEKREKLLAIQTD